MVENLPANSGDTYLTPGLGRSPGEGNGTPLKYSCLKNSMNRGAWQVTVCGVPAYRLEMGVSGNIWIVVKDVKTLVVYDVE